MNLRVGLWRTGMVINGLISLLTLVIYGISESPSRANLEWRSVDKLASVIYDAQTPAFRSEVRQYEIKEKVWPAKSNSEILKLACRQASSSEFKQVCADFKSEVEWLWWDWTKHIAATIFFTFLAGTVVAFLWWCFSWVVLGFAEPKDQPPKS